nr:hypothetical protein [Tanacetum cinerariifolium]
MGHFSRECTAPKGQERGRRENYRQGSKEEEQAPKALMTIDGVGWDWSFMENEKENHALVADEEAPAEFALMAKSSTDNEVFDNSLCSKACKKNTDSLNSKITELSEKLGDTKNMLVVPPPPAQVYSPPKKDMSWTGLHEFADDTITDYSRPSPAIKSNSDDLQNRNPSVTETGASSIKTQVRVPRVPTVNRKFPTVNRKFPTGNSNFSTADLGNKEKAGNSHINIDDKGYWDSGCSRYMTGNISYLSDYEPFDGGYVSFGQGGCKITGKGTIKT